MSLLKSSSNTKLDDVLGEEFKDLPGVVLVRCSQLVKQLYKETEEPRRRIHFQMKKNSFRLLVSLLAVIWQLYWFSAYYIHDNSTTSITFACEQADRKISAPSSKASFSENLMRFDKDYDEDESLVHIGNTSLDSTGLVYCPRTSRHNWKQYAHYNHKPYAYRPEDSHMPQSEIYVWPKPVSTVLDVIWKLFMLIKLICLMVFFEMLRLLDTIWKSLVKEDEDETKKNAKKSPVDVRYIERNRGYK